MMDEVQIVTYSPENHSAVRRLFSNGMLEHRKAAVFCGLKSAKLQILIVSAFMLGYFLSSLLLGALFVIPIIGIQVIMVCWCYQEYVRNALDTDMKDAKLEYWTTKPNVFLVAKTSRGQIVGCIAYKENTEDTVEMYRASVDEHFRGLKIGQKLVKALEKVAKERGYKKMYLITGCAQVPAMKLYEKLGFQFHANLDLPFNNYLIDIITGIYLVAYIKDL